MIRTHECIGSWIIRNKTTGAVICEVFSATIAAAINTSKYEAVPIGEYLGELNRRIRQQGGQQCKR